MTMAMLQFFHDVADFSFLQYAMIGGIIASISCGVVGSYIVSRRITYLAGGVAHCTFGGIGLAGYLQYKYELTWLDPIYGAIVAALLSALIIGLISIKAHQREDTVISAIWALGMAIGVFFVSITPGYSQDLQNYLFGNILLISKNDLWLMAGLDLVVIMLSIVFYNKFLAVCFDQNFAQLRGVKTNFYFLLLLCMTALTVVVLIRVVGLIMVIALLALPAAVANQFCSRLHRMMIVSCLLSVFFVVTGIAVSHEPGWPPGAIIILIAGLIYLVTILITRGKKIRWL